MELSDIQPDKQSNPAVEPLEDLVTEKTLNEESRLPQKSQDETEDLDDDLISIQTETDILLPIEKNSEIPVQEHKLGLDINAIRGWSGSQYDDYDVIAVHGIRDDYKTAWMDKKGGWVLKERLFKGLSIREIDYSYEIDQNSILYRQNGIDILAESLLDSYAKEREHLAGTETDRPIIWACHDIGGTIVKQALFIASQNVAKYGKIFMHTTGIVFIGTPHRFKSHHDALDQIYQLLFLPGPDIQRGVSRIVEHLTEQISLTNKQFVTTKLLDRACIFNIISRSITDSLTEIADGRNYDKVRAWSKATVTPFHRYSHFIGHSFESSGRVHQRTVNHLDLIRDEGCSALESFSKRFEMTGFSK
ncbi:hypothetical protein FPOAC1_000094 [Fusarium poae]|uniref:hypothetical protein n=1 Tax=Fusarium poae TaxID=36050 RepID=UPI001CE86561|nr:hypothetical protein FPOAC1_000094 [Fusarium poae]KAG8674131.1 hypothetical protein FPOAC1_000094 [Fusarium poae]